MLQRGRQKDIYKGKNQTEISRRTFLQTASTAVLGFTAIQTLGCETNFVEPLTDGLQIPFLTPVEDFFVRVGAEVSIANWEQPAISQNDWRLTIDGLVDNSLSISYPDLLNLSASGNAVTILKTMRCIIDTNEVGGLIGTALWTGIPLDVFTDQAGIQTGARRLRIYGSDGFTNNIKIDRVKGNNDVELFPPILVTHMNGELLPPVHGGPVRLLLSEAFGYKNVKWIERVEAVASDDPFGTYQDVGFIDDGELRVVSKITNPIGNGTISAGTNRVFGVAVSGASSVDRVEYSIDGGPWSNTEFVSLDDVIANEPEVATAAQFIAGREYPYRSVWTQWYFDADLEVGEHEIRVRAIDLDGNSQPETDLDISDSVNAFPVINITVEPRT